MVSTLGARFGNHTSYQSCEANADFGTPRGGRRTVPMRRPSFFALGVPNLTTRTAMTGPLLKTCQALGYGDSRVPGTASA
jgi:hypothetical protein